MKKVILVHINHPALDQRLHKMSLTLHKNGYEVLQIGRKTSEKLPLPKVPYKVEQIPVIFKTGKLAYAEFMTKLFFKLLFKKFDILCANDLDTLPPSFFATKIKRKPLVYDTHEFFTGSSSLVNRNFTRKIWEKIEDFFFPKLKTIITVNESVAQKYKIKYRKDLHIIYNYPSQSARVNNSVKEIKPDEEIKLIYQGRILHGRGISLMIEALKELPENVKLYIYGSGEYLPEIEAKIKKLNLQDRALLKGAVPYDKLPHITAQTHIGFSIESAKVPNMKISTPNKLFDYLMQGLPVIVSKLPNHSKIVNENQVGIVLQNRTAQDIANAVKFFINNPEFYKRCSENALNASQTKFFWEKQEPTILNIYKNAQT